MIGIAVSAQDQVGSIRGLVLDKEFDAPLAGVQVLAVETGQRTRTSEQGNFVLGQVAAGRYTLVFAKDGYARLVRSDVVVGAGRVTEVNAVMTGDFTEMEEFVVQDALQLTAGSEQALLQLRLEGPALMDSISADLMSRAGTSDAASALRLVAGASVQDGKSAVIRGLPDRYVSSQMNGVRLPSADEDKRAVELDQFPGAVIESIQVSKTFTPDQQGDASGGAVDVRLKGIPSEPFFVSIKGEASHNTQVTGRADFLTYEGGGVSHWGKDDGARRIQYDNIGTNWEGAVGVSEGQAPVDYKWSGSMGGRHELMPGLRIGGFASFFYERDSSFHDHGVDDSNWVESPGAPMTPKTYQGTVGEGDFKTALFDVTQGEQVVQWGTLGTFGVETDDHSLNFTYLYTRTAEDSATLAEDTRGKQYYFPGHNPDDPTTPGHDKPDAAPYLRLETLEYTERTTDTLQVHGRHGLPVDRFLIFGRPELSWTIAHSSADLYQPDKRQFGSAWYPGRQIGPIYIPPTHRPFKPSANFTLGNLQRIWKEIDETSDQYAADLKLPFSERREAGGYVKLGVFRDTVRRDFDQESFSNFNDNSSFEGPWKQRWSGSFPFENHRITESLYDVDYRGDLKVSAYYAMVDLPVADNLNLIGGARVETTTIGIVNDPEENALWYPPGSLTPTKLNPGDADVSFQQDDLLPSLGLVYRPLDTLTLRASYNETIARQTFKELTPILQQEYLGGPIFIGNPDLGMSSLRNYDLRVDFTPYAGGLFSASWFRKDIKDPIEYVQRVASFDFTTAVNYPKGEMNGFELEMRHSLGQFWEPMGGVAVGVNATYIDAKVNLPEDEARGFRLPNIRAPMDSRDMTNAPEYLWNAYMTYDLPTTGTQLAVFYTVQGDTLVAGAGQSNGNYVPNVYAQDYDTLNLTVSQRLGEFVKVQFGAKNLTNPRIEEVYRSPYIGGDVLKTSYTRGVEFTFGIGGEVRF
ncbi:MAG: TonB-dependent receptor [Planctomycetes bacterium]|nr:TonB-dependent receptor [Planctomycetota bacterium]